MTRECSYCQHWFDCEHPNLESPCMYFKVMKEREEAYREWIADQGFKSEPKNN